MYIERITIKKFRSIVDSTFYAKNITVFVGENDVGKSNILKALNLFFNNQTDVDQGFDFFTDYSRLAVSPKKKAKEIIIEILLSPPSTFESHLKKILWTKKWREEGLYKGGEKIIFADGSPIPGSRSRIGVWLNRLRYYYVPAIKSNDYFSHLLKKLYETLYSTIKIDLQNAGQQFVSNIQEHTKLLSDELYKKLDLESKIQLPEDLSNLFSTLDFETISKEQPISLKQRGDGIKVRHLPVILKFLADKEHKHHSKGAVRSDSIWGYEEPENNLELFKAFELAENFEKYSNDIQIFLTTHSPAFYTIGKNQSETIKYNTFKDINDSFTKLSKIEKDSIKDLDKSMGLMPIVAPYIKEKMNENLELKKIITDLKDETKPILFVEGPNDKIILENAWQKLRNSSRMPFKIQQSYDRFFIGNEFRREDLFKNNEDNIFIGMFDFDEAFENWIRLIKEKPESWGRIENDHAKGLLLKHTKHRGYVFLLPVPNFRNDYANEQYGKNSLLSLELLFQDEKLTGYVEGKQLPGGGSVLRMNDRKKADFANKTNLFNKDDFLYFEPIFGMIVDCTPEVGQNMLE